MGWLLASHNICADSVNWEHLCLLLHYTRTSYVAYTHTHTHTHAHTFIEYDLPDGLGLIYY